VDVLEVMVVVVILVALVLVEELWQIDTKSSQQSFSARHDISHWHARCGGKAMLNPQPRTEHSDSGDVAVGAVVVGSAVGVDVGGGVAGIFAHPVPSGRGRHVEDSATHCW